MQQEFQKLCIIRLNEHKYDFHYFTNFLCVCNLEPEPLPSFCYAAFNLKQKGNFPVKSKKRI